MLCLVNTVHGSHVLGMAEVVLVLHQLTQANEQASFRTQKPDGLREISEDMVKMR